MLDASGQISGNQVSNVVADADTPYSNAAVGIYIDTFDIPGVTASVDNNTVSGTAIGINVMALDNPSDITGNSVAMPGGDNVFGIVVRDMETVAWASQAEDSGIGMTVANNQIDASGSTGTGIYLYDNPDPNNPVLIENNSVTATSASSVTGINVSDDGSPFGDSTLAADYATLSGNTLEQSGHRHRGGSPQRPDRVGHRHEQRQHQRHGPRRWCRPLACLDLGNSSGLGSGYLTVNAGLLNVNSYGLSVTALSGSGGIITDNSGAGGTTTVIVYQASDTTYSGLLEDGGNGTTVALALAGPGTLTLDGADTNSGPTTISAGTLQDGNSAALQNSTVTVGVAGGLTFSAGLGSAALGGLAGSGNVRLRRTRPWRRWP